MRNDPAFRPAALLRIGERNDLELAGLRRLLGAARLPRRHRGLAALWTALVRVGRLEVEAAPLAVLQTHESVCKRAAASVKERAPDTQVWAGADRLRNASMAPRSMGFLNMASTAS